ncbi:MAG TPA: hypothetical protein VK869_04170, partial [Rubrobacteraceae bacterium]|nr:hypothetical protein [Rubrobacteraceae bacterium]
MTIKVEGEEDFEVLRSLIDVLEQKKIGAYTETPEHAAGRPWSEEAFVKLWSDITEQARRVMREIAKKPEGYSGELLTRNLNITGAELGRCMSS